MNDVSIYCPYCHQHTALSIAPTGLYSTSMNPIQCIWKDFVGQTWWIGVCNNSRCKRPVLARNAGDIIYPYPLPEPTDQRVPEDIRNDLNEAKLCFSVSAYKGAATLARRTIQAVCIDKGATANKLEDQIDELFATQVITNEIKEWGHAVRWIGNDGAHPDKKPVGKEEAQDVINLAEEFVKIIYVTPAIAATYQRKKKP